MSIKDSSHSPDSTNAVRPEDLKTKGYLSSYANNLRNPYIALTTGMHQVTTEVRQLLSDLHYTLTNQSSSENDITPTKLTDFGSNGVQRRVVLKHGTLLIDASLTESGQLVFSFSEFKPPRDESQEPPHPMTTAFPGANRRHPANSMFSLLRMMYPLKEADKLYHLMTGKVRSSVDDEYISSRTYSDDRIYTWEFDILTDYIDAVFLDFAERRNLDVWHCFTSKTTLKIQLTDR